MARRRLNVSFTNAGDHALTATFAGDAFHAPATVSAIEHVLRSDSVLALESSLNPSPAGTGVTFTAIATIAGSTTHATSATITFMDGDDCAWQLIAGCTGACQHYSWIVHGRKSYDFGDAGTDGFVECQ